MSRRLTFSFSGAQELFVSALAAEVGATMGEADAEMSYDALGTHCERAAQREWCWLTLRLMILQAWFRRSWLAQRHATDRTKFFLSGGGGAATTGNGVSARLRAAASGLQWRRRCGAAGGSGRAGQTRGSVRRAPSSY